MYGTLSDADTFFENDLTGTWDNYTDAQKTKALNEATRIINQLHYRGEKYDYTPDQNDQFPRIEQTPTRTYYFDDDFDNGGVKVPTDVERAAYMQAKYLLDSIVGNLHGVAEKVRAGITSISTGGTSESYDKSASAVDVKTGLHRDAFNLLKKYMIGAC